MPRISAISDLDAERALVGAALLDAGVLDHVEIAPEMFAGGATRRIWRAMLALHAEGKPLDEYLVPLRAEVAPTELTTCVLTTPTADNAAHYADVVREHAVTRAVLSALAELQDAHRRGHSGTALLDAALAKFTALEMGTPRRAIPIDALVRERLGELGAIAEARARGESWLSGVPTGLDNLDALLGGFQRGIVTIVAARPGMGKSAFALGCADAASAASYGVHVFSLEDPRAAYADRVVSRVSGVPVEDLRATRFTPTEFADVVGSCAELHRRQNWQYEDVSDITAEALVRAVRRERVANRTQLVIVDYLQLLRRPKRHESIHDAITQNMNTLANAAKHDNIAYVVLSQLSRTVERRNNKRPMLSDLRESGSIEERAKCVLGLYRGAYYGPPQPGIDYDDGSNGPEPSHDGDDGDGMPGTRPTDADWKQLIEIHVLKNSNGRTGYVRSRWHGATTRVH